MKQATHNQKQITMTTHCKCCGRVLELRFGACYDCAESESIIENGTDMYDEIPPKIDGMSASMSKLQYILKKYIKIKTDNNDNT